jgi:RPA family protein
MSESEDSGPGRREVAHRLFAAEFDDAEFSYSESDEERAPNYVVTPTGARVNRVFVVGVLTELEQVNEEVLRARIVDPTGPFVVYAGQYQPEALAFLEAATPPLFVAVTGKARTFEPEDSDRVFTSIRPESISEVDGETRDRWVVQAAEQTVDRVARMASAKRSGLSGDALQTALVEAGVTESDADGAALALDYYGTTGDYLQAVRDLALNATRVVAGERDEAGSLSLSPGDGTDDPLAVLATMDLEAPAETTSAEADDSAVVEADDSATTETTSSEAEPSDESEPEGQAATAETAEPETTVTTSEPDDARETADASETATEDDVPSEPTAAETDEPAEATAGSTETVSESTEATAESTETRAESTEPTTTEPTTESESTAATETADEGTSGTLGDFDSGPAGETEDADAEEDDEVGDFDTEFDLDEDEREEIEEEYGTDFQSGTEVDDAGEAGIETPDPEELAEAEAAAAGEESTEAAAASESAAETADATEPATEESGSADAGDEPAEDVDLEDAVMDVMTELNDGGGADRDAVRSTVVEEYGADRDAVEDAIQDALMGGRCYEPDDGKLTPI